MNFKIISPDATGKFDGVLQNQMLRFMQKGGADAIPFVPVSYYPNYQFNGALNTLKPNGYVFCDMTEYGHEWDQVANNMLGQGITRNFGHLASDEWAKLDNFVRDCPPLLHFKRELKLTDQSPTVMPCEHLCYIDIPAPVTKEQFDSRLIEVNHTWGFSHASRVALHADIFRAMNTHGIGVISELNHLSGYSQDARARTWASIYKPWYARSPMSELIALQLQSKITTSLKGAGVKCFRSSEAPVGSIMALHEDKLAWSFPWLHADNCIRITEGREFVSLEYATHFDFLYDIYLAGQENLKNYRSQQYVDGYIIPQIQKLL